MTAPEWSTTLRARWRTAVEPRADGLPNARVIGIPLLALLLVFLGLVAFGVTGSSTGAVHSQVSTEADEDLLWGEPQLIRTDEWYVQTTWTISQVEQGLPVRNETFPGGMDATVQHDLPSADWSTAFRPHLLGFFVLPLDQAMAVKWWMPGLALIAAAYVFLITLLPRRPVTSLALAVALFFAPFFQWWYLSITFYPAAWAFLVMAAVVWALRSRRRAGVWVLAALVGYLTVTVGMGIYVPFIVPAAIVAVAFGIGAVVSRDFNDGSFWQRLRSIWPIFAAGAAAVVVLLVWILTRWDTIQGFLGTVYPGQRLAPVGRGGSLELGGLLSGPLSVTLERMAGAPFGPNSSEASSFLLPGIGAAVVLAWSIWRRWRARRSVDWLSVALFAVGLVMLAYLFIPGWDWLSHLLLLDRTTYARMRLGFGILSVVLVAVAVMRIDERDPPARPPLLVSLGATALTIASIGVMVLLTEPAGGLSHLFASLSPRLVFATVVLGVMFVVSVWALCSGRAALGALLLAAVSFVSTVGVNPLYRGVLDVRETEAVAEIQEIDEDRGGAWVGVGDSWLVPMALVESGVTAYNGFQSAPSTEMWEQIDPDGQDEDVWNRLANVSWEAGEGDPDPRNPAADQIRMTFDSCGDFAQAHVSWVLTDTDIVQPCLTEYAQVPQGPSTLRIYEVTAPAAP
ncbi:hypothetical protein ACFVR6_13355 [Microbacterium sp. NPDC058021]|uniref:DUF7657 domain-containing protein n=1 Tax=Microbacterium sp. NPDC058021 TaxID=3346306 RepID=UPI0036DB9189